MKFTFIFLLLILFLAEAQRGGGSSSSSSSRSSRRSSYRSWGSKPGGSTWNSTSGTHSSSESGSILWLVPFGGIFAAVAYFANKNAQKLAAERSKKLE